MKHLEKYDISPRDDHEFAICYEIKNTGEYIFMRLITAQEMKRIKNARDIGKLSIISVETWPELKEIEL